jgi:hypothetical protein
MTSPVQPLVRTQLANSSTLLYTSPVGVWTQIVKLACVNTDTASHTVTFHVVPSGGSSGTTNITTDGQGVLPAQTWNSPNEYGLVLAPGDALYGLADTASVVNVFAAGILVTS